MRNAILIAVLLCSACRGVNPALGAASFNQGVNRSQCQQSCTPGDGQCYQGCAALYPQNPPPTYQPIQTPTQLDYNCLNQCTQSGYTFQLCKKNCSY